MKQDNLRKTKIIQRQKILQKSRSFVIFLKLDKAGGGFVDISYGYEKWRNAGEFLALDFRMDLYENKIASGLKYGSSSFSSLVWIWVWIFGMSFGYA